MALKTPLVLYGSVVSQLQAGDTLADADVLVATNGDTVTLPPGTVVCSKASGSVARGNATALATSRVLGVMFASTAAAAQGPVWTDGMVTLTTAQWDAVVTGESGGLTPGAVYFLDPATPGNLTATVPSAATQFLVSLGVAISPTQLDLDIQAPIGL